ncbi:hypothetical protein EJ05DRAFT_437667 [Pseudovirgaria hyperparasitica]|uniref:BHLH domain-containing protein n=1 Tax=Pseudovirgaria hyperparasitica TaxID=470096 RepID=A0A6A6W8P5_9PEZI|nr:uncharacterized protein EJ05DRAFT_437667 [Pseudovirgaria hyperparasitica]KAF2759033.1 hypothetical protein EJ05DRAFT_437667 [Pseudovirgaria hyperparasitica]
MFEQISLFGDFEDLDSPVEEDCEGLTTANKSDSMEDPNMSSEFPSFNAAPWMNSTAAEDSAMLARSGSHFAQSNWEEWMRWEPGPESLSSNSVDTPSLLQTDPGTSPDQNSQSDSHTLQRSSHSPDTHHLDRSSVRNEHSFDFGSNLDVSSGYQFNYSSLPASSRDLHGFPNDTYLEPLAWENGSQFSLSNTGPLNAETMSKAAGQFKLGTTPSSETSPSAVKFNPTPVTSGSAGSESSPEPARPEFNRKKRKASTSDEEKDSSDRQEPVKKTAHNMIEKRYRTNLNDKIAALRDSVPSLRVMSRPNGTLEDDDPEDLEGLTPAHKLNKATVLAKATEYIRHLEKRNKRLNDELADYKTRLDNFNKLAMTRSMGMATMAMADSGIRYSEDTFTGSSSSLHASAQATPQGMIPVPESMANLHRRNKAQSHYASTPYGSYLNPPPGQNMAGQPPMVQGRGGGGFMNKIMIGSFAGLMILEGLAERKESNEDTKTESLFGLPVELFGEWATISIPPVTGSNGPGNVLPLFKFVLVIFALMYLAWPILTSKPKSKKAPSTITRVTPTLSLASPVELRCQAWLTAVQSIWVPQHSFLAEITALGLKICKLSTRHLIGWQGYAFLTGATREQEEGRVKAWSIALDAQLTGGDAEINVRRLILTLMASGTLPDTPGRLMLKALHIRVLLWEVANTKIGAWYKFEEISAKLARHYWNQARAEHRMMTSRAEIVDSERLPTHLAALLDIECDDVLVHPLIQRAYNLAWNKPSGENTDVDLSLDSVLEDFAISGPLDALAAWWSGLILNRALVDSFDKDSTWTEDLKLAVDTAPPNSGAQVRALVAKSILLDSNRDEEVATAFNAVPLKLSESSSAAGPLMNVVGTAPVSSDVIKALTMARCLSLAEASKATGSVEARIRATFPIRTNLLNEYTLSLLSFVAAYKILLSFSNDFELLADSSEGLERLASLLRLWVGRETGRKSGFSREIRGEIIEKCVRLSKVFTGMGEKTESDDGYVSGDDETSGVGFTV